MDLQEIPPQFEILEAMPPCDSLTGENPEIRMSHLEKELPPEVEADIKQAETTAENTILTWVCK